MTESAIGQPNIRAVTMNLFPTMDSLQSAVDFAESKLPIKDKNEMFSVLMIYHNTLLKAANESR